MLSEAMVGLLKSMNVTVEENTENKLELGLPPDSKNDFIVEVSDIIYKSCELCKMRIFRPEIKRLVPFGLIIMIFHLESSEESLQYPEWD